MRSGNGGLGYRLDTPQMHGDQRRNQKGKHRGWTSHGTINVKRTTPLAFLHSHKIDFAYVFGVLKPDEPWTTIHLARIASPRQVGIGPVATTCHPSAADGSTVYNPGRGSYRHSLRLNP